MKDKREHARVGAQLLVELSHPDLGRRMCGSRDISEQGVFVLTTEDGEQPLPLRVGEALTLTIHGAMQPLPKQISARVVRVENGGLGLWFERNPFADVE